MRGVVRHVAARRVVDVIGPAGLTLAAVGTGHLRAAGHATVAVGGDGEAENVVQARVREARPLVELRAPFTVNRQQVDDVARGAKDADWQPVKDAAKRIAFDGFGDSGVIGIIEASSNPSVALPADVTAYPDAVAQAMTQLRLAGVGGPYTLLLSAQAYTSVAETADHGYPVREHIARVLGVVLTPV